MIRFGDKHLRAHVFELSVFEYYLIDVTLVVITVAMISWLTIRLICQMCCRLCKPGKKKND